MIFKTAEYALRAVASLAGRMGQPASADALAEDVRSQFHRARIALTVYGNCSVRLSLPMTRLTPNQREQLAAAFRIFQLRNDRVFSTCAGAHNSHSSQSNCVNSLGTVE